MVLPSAFIALVKVTVSAHLTGFANQHINFHPGTHSSVLFGEGGVSCGPRTASVRIRSNPGSVASELELAVPRFCSVM